MKRDYDDTGTTGTMDRRKGGQSEDQSGKSGADREELMKKAEAAGKPGPGHQALDYYVGDWKAEVKCWMEPGSPANVSQGTAKVSWVMNGRFLEEDFRGDMMGKPFRGRTVTGFDNVTQTYRSVWISDMQTSMFVTEGKGENGNKVLTLKGTTSCPMRGTDIPMKLVLRVLGPDKHIFEMFDESQGPNAKTMEITYTRQ
jgi:hypothetical protein